jgi:hypothetical protein
MIRIEGRGAVYGEIWFNEELPLDAGIDIAIFRQRDNPVEGARNERFVSLTTALDVPEDAIMSRFGRESRYQIRRADDARDGLSLEFLRDPAGRLEDFGNFYNACLGATVPPCDMQWLSAAHCAGQLALSAAVREGKPLVWHAYMLSGKSAHLMFSASSYRDHTGSMRTLVGRANRWLHWRSMLRLRELGLTHYDWGGLFEYESSTNRVGINRFKEDFGGHRVCTYNCVLPLTLRGRLYLPLREAWHRLTTTAATNPAAGEKLSMPQPQRSPDVVPTRRIRAGAPGTRETSKSASG